MLWKSNINNTISEDKENSIEELQNNHIEHNICNVITTDKNTSITVDARKSDNYNYASEDICEL